MKRQATIPSDAGATRATQLATEEFVALRLSNDSPDPNHLMESPISDSYSVVIQLKDFVSHRSWRGGRLVYSGGHLKGSMGIVYQGDDLRCRNFSAFDNLRFSIPRRSLDDLCSSEGLYRVESPDCPFGTLDPTFAHLAQALLPTLEQPEAHNRLFIDEIMMAMCTHVATHYGYARARAQRPARLAPWQERRAKELITSNLAGGLSMASLADACGLSRSHFSRAFHGSTGMSPHQWLTRMRIERAKELLVNHRSITAIALDCGFADLAHFSRVFARLVGAPPSHWRRVQML